MLIKVILTLVGLLVGAGIMFPVAVNYRKRTAEKEIGSAEEEAKRIINESIKSAENKKREMMVDGRGLDAPERAWGHELLDFTLL